MRVVTINYRYSCDETRFNWNMDFIGEDTLLQLDILKYAIRALEVMRETVLEDFEAEFKCKNTCEIAKSILGV